MKPPNFSPREISFSPFLLLGVEKCIGVCRDGSCTTTLTSVVGEDDTAMTGNVFVTKADAFSGRVPTDKIDIKAASKFVMVVYNTVEENMELIVLILRTHWIHYLWVGLIRISESAKIIQNQPMTSALAK